MVKETKETYQGEELTEILKYFGVGARAWMLFDSCERMLPAIKKFAEVDITNEEMADRLAEVMLNCRLLSIFVGEDKVGKAIRDKIKGEKSYMGKNKEEEG